MYTIQDTKPESIWPDAEERLQSPPVAYGINRGGEYGFDTKTDIYGIVKENETYSLCLINFLGIGAATVRYLTKDVILYVPVPAFRCPTCTGIHFRVLKKIGRQLTMKCRDCSHQVHAMMIPFIPWKDGD